MELKNGMVLKVRKAEKGDAKEIIDYLNRVGGESDNLLFGANEFRMTVEAEESFIVNLAGSNTSGLFVGRIDNKLVCVGSLFGGQKERVSHQADLALSVSKEYWGLGIGTHLIQIMIEFARENAQTEIIHLGVKEDNRGARALYKKMGFIEIGRYKHFFKIGEEYWDEVLMNLYLK